MAVLEPEQQGHRNGEQQFSIGEALHPVQTLAQRRARPGDHEDAAGQKTDGRHLPGLAEHPGKGQAIQTQRDVDDLARQLRLDLQSATQDADAHENARKQDDRTDDLDQADRQIGGHRTVSTTKSL